MRRPGHSRHPEVKLGCSVALHRREIDIQGNAMPQHVGLLPLNPVVAVFSQSKIELEEHTGEDETEFGIRKAIAVQNMLATILPMAYRTTSPHA